MRCALAPGEALTEKAVCERYGVSRTPVREALAALRAEGFVHLLPNKGAVVEEIDLATVFMVYETRIPLEKAAATFAAIRGAEAHFVALDPLIDRLTRSAESGDLDGYFEADRAIHDLIATMAHNAMIERQIAILRAHTSRIWHHYRDRFPGEDTDLDTLLALVDAIRRRDPTAAGDAMVRHLRSYLKVYEAHFWQPLEALHSV